MPYFWDCDWETLSWEQHADFIIRRILQAGDWESICWLRLRLGDGTLRTWLESQRGGGLSPRQMRFWELVLYISPGKVTRWIHKFQTLPWAGRIAQ